MRDTKGAAPKLQALAELIVRARHNAGGISQAEMGERLGVARSTVARWESAGGGLPKLEGLLALVRDFDVPGEDVARAVGLLPDDDTPELFDDPDVQAIWDLGERRGWPEGARWGLIHVWRGRRASLDDSEEVDRLAAAGE